MKRNVTAVALLVVWLAAAGAAMGQAAAPLADKLPEQSLLYLGWGGLGANRAALNATGAGRLVDDPEVKPHLEAMCRQLEAFVKGQAEQNLPPGAFEAIRSLLVEVVAERPWALTVIDLRPPGPDGPPVIEAALLIDTADKTNAALANIDRLLKLFLPAEALEQIGDMQVIDAKLRSLQVNADAPAILWGGYRNHVLIAVGVKAAGQVVTAMDGGAAALSGNARFAKVAGKTGGGLCVLYADVARFRGDLLPGILAMSVPDEQAREQINKVVAALGLDAVEAVGGAVRADGADFVRSAYVLTPTKGGLLTLFDQKPVSADLLAVVPGDATWALAGNFNRGRLMDELTARLAAFPEVKAEFDRNRKAVEAAVGLNLRTDLAEAIGDGVAIYNSPSAGGFLYTGLTVVNEVRDAARVRAAMPRLCDAFLDQLAAADPDIKEKVSFRKGEFAGVEYHYTVVRGLPVPVAPAWCVTDKYMVFSLFPQTLKAALMQIQAGRAGSLAENQWLAAQLSGPARGACAISYVNQRQMLRIVYPVALPLWQMGCAMAGKVGVELDVNALPRQELLLKHIGDSFGAVVPDPEGILCIGRSGSPLPGVIGAAFTNPMLVTVLLPALGQARQAAQKTQSAANLKGLAYTCAIYAAQNDGRWPDSLDSLVEADLMRPDGLRSPVQKGPGESYVYVKPAVRDHLENHRMVLAYERPENYGGKGTNVLFMDGHVKWMDLPEFQARLEATRKAWAEEARAAVR